MNKILVFGSAAAAIFVCSGVAAQAAPAQEAGPAAPGPAHQHNMQPVTRAEVEARVARSFAKLDTNHDGFITKDEVRALDAKREAKMEERAQRFDPSKIFDRLDLNHDGQITVAEAEAARSQHAASTGKPVKAQATAFGGLFARADTNKDGVITRAEFDAMGQEMKARMEKAGMARGSMAERMFDTADTNKDGRLSLAELQQAALARFDRLDLNHDGTISPEERQQARQLIKAQHHKS